MKKLLFVTTICLSVILMTQWSMAQPPAEPQGPPPPASAGKGDKPLPPQGPPPERPRVEEVFKKADKDADGYLTLDEFLTIHKNRPPMHPEAKGRKHGGNPSNTEKGNRPYRDNRVREGKPQPEVMKARAEEIFKKADKNGDGKLSLDEFKTIRPPQGPRPPMPPERPIPPGRKPGPEGQKPHAEGIAKMLKEADANHDGKVSLEELKAIRPHMTPERFKFMDSNGDGFITKEDVQDWAERAKAKFKEADTDNDGKLSREEIKKIFPNMTDEAFNRRDLNKDGFLTPDELKPKFRNN